MIHFRVQSRGAPVGTLEAAPKDAFSNLHKDAQKGIFEVALKCAREVAPWVAPVVALVDAMINLQICTKWCIQ